MITVKAEELSEQHLAEVALAIQNRWNVATFVKMHEVIVMDDEDDGNSMSSHLDSREVERGLNVIMGNLELDRAFALERKGKAKFNLKLVNPSGIPKWVERSAADMSKPPEGVYACPHCGRWFNTQLEQQMHTKLHYII